jgi:hypothetical protein
VVSPYRDPPWHRRRASSRLLVRVVDVVAVVSAIALVGAIVSHSVRGHTRRETLTLADPAARSSASKTPRLRIELVLRDSADRTEPSSTGSCTCAWRDPLCTCIK